MVWLLLSLLSASVTGSAHKESLSVIDFYLYMYARVQMTQMSGNTSHSAVGALVRRNEKLRETNKHLIRENEELQEKINRRQAESILHLT